MAHRPLSTTKDRTGPMDRAGESIETTQFEEFPCACEELTRYSEPLYIKMHVIDSHIDAHTCVILLTRIFMLAGAPACAKAQRAR